jgi:hypothetical protein
MSYIYIVSSSRWPNIIVLNAHASIEGISGATKKKFGDPLEQVFYQFPNYHKKTLFGDFNAKLRREDIFKHTNGRESLRENRNNKCVRIVIFAT